MMKNNMMLMLLVAVMGVSLLSCTKEETTIGGIGNIDNRTYDKELKVTKQDLVNYELIMGEFGDTIRYFLFKNSKAAYVFHNKNINSISKYLIFSNWSVSNGKLTMSSDDDEEKRLEFNITKMYKKLSDSEYVLQVILRENENKYVFYASEDGRKHEEAQAWWNAITE